MTKSLTEKWKNEQLEDGFYWLKVNVGCGDYIDIVKYNSDDVDFARYYNDCIKEVIEKVPSYEEYQVLLSDQLAKNEVVEINAELLHKIEQLEKQIKMVEYKGKVK